MSDEVPEPPGYSPERATAVHEAGHAVMAYLLSRAFTEISVIEDSDSYGRSGTACQAGGSARTSRSTPGPAP